jgi:hypothetical protein
VNSRLGTAAEAASPVYGQGPSRGLSRAGSAKTRVLKDATAPYPTPTRFFLSAYNGNSSVSSRTSFFTRATVASSRLVTT